MFFGFCLHELILSQAEDVRRVADNELGFQQLTLSRPTQAKTYLFINTERLVVGCLIAEPIRQVTPRSLTVTLSLGYLSIKMLMKFYPTGLQSPRAARSTQRHDQGRLHGAPQGLVLLDRPRESSVWDQSDLGLQPGPTPGHRHPHAGHCQVHNTETTDARISL